jgi:hypothetical protein
MPAHPTGLNMEISIKLFRIFVWRFEASPVVSLQRWVVTATAVHLWVCIMHFHRFGLERPTIALRRKMNPIERS